MRGNIKLALLLLLLAVTVTEASANSADELRMQLIGPQGALTSPIAAMIEHNIKTGNRPFFSMSDVRVEINGRSSSEKQIKQQIRGSFLTALTNQGQFQKENQANSDLTVRYIESIPDNYMFFQSDRVQGIMHVAVKLGAEHNFEKGPVLVVDRSMETIAVRVGLFVFVLMLMLYFGRQSGMIYEFGFRAIASLLVVVTGCLSIGGLL